MSGPKMARREAVQLIAAFAAAPTLIAAGAGTAAALTPGNMTTALRDNRPAAPSGSFSDPDMIDPQWQWPRVLDDEQLDLLNTLCDLILPEDEVSPSAASLGAPKFIDEWVSAPFPQMARDRETVGEGLAWVNAEAEQRYGRPFVRLDESEQTVIIDEICGAQAAAAGAEAGEKGFDRIRQLTATAFYTTPEGMRDLNFIGNTPQASWGPPPELALRHVGLSSDKDKA